MAFTPTPIGGDDTVRYGFKLTRQTLWLPAISDGSLVPSEQEISDGTDLTPAIQAYNGFSLSPRYAETPDIMSQVDGKVFDGASLDDSSIVFYLANDDDDALSFFTQGDDGYILDCPRGLLSEARAYVWKAEVSTKSPTVATSGAALGTVSFAIFAYREVTLPQESS